MSDVSNDPELNGKYLGTISSDFIKISDTLREASYQIRTRGFSEYPIFPVSKEDIVIGHTLIRKNELDLKWNYNVTYLDEMVQLNIITKKEVFVKNYKDPDEFCCLLVIDTASDFTNFVFIPYPID